MSEQNLGDDPSDIYIKRPFNIKTLRELDRQQLDYHKKIKRKERRASANKTQDQTSHSHILIDSEDRILSKLPEVVRNGNRIRAEWKNDQIHGLAQIFYQNGIYFKGQYQNGSKVKGHFKFKSGFQYIGNSHGNKFAGDGVLKFPNGKTIQGQWKNFQVLGNGKISYPKGEVYFGEIKNFKKHGQGYFYFSDGSKYQGEFVDGMINGRGSYFVDGKIVSAGTWFNGELEKTLSQDNQNYPFSSTMNNTFTDKEHNTNTQHNFRDIKNIKDNVTSKSKKSLQELHDNKKNHFN